MRTRVHASVYAAQRRPSFKMHAQSALDASQVCACMQQQLFQLETIRCNFKCASIRVAFQRRCVVNEAAVLASSPCGGRGEDTDLSHCLQGQGELSQESEQATHSDAHQTGNSAAALRAAGRQAAHTHTQQCTQQCRSINRCSRIFRLPAAFRARPEIRASIIERHRLCMCMQMLGAHLHICLYFERGERRTPVLTFDCGSYFMRPIGREPLARAHKKSHSCNQTGLGETGTYKVYECVMYTRTVLVSPGQSYVFE